jgi:hypothetical protein
LGFSPLEPEIVRKFTIDDFRELGLLSDKGRIRLLFAQRYFDENENYFPLLLQLYETWRDQLEYMVFRCRCEQKEDYIAVKCSKRGNDVYNARIKHRFRFFEKNIGDLRFFSIDDFKTDKKVKTKLLWVTLTWNPRLFSIKNSWKREVSQAWNRFITALRRRYGKIEVLRSWEATRQGYPHIHAILWFESSEFTVFPHYSEKEGQLQFRIEEKHEFESFWHSLIDVQAMSSLKKMVSYVMKYQLKVNEGKEDYGSGSCTLAFMWLFRKRSFACSRGLQKKFTDLTEVLHNSNMDGGVEWEFLGVFSGSVLGLHGEYMVRLEEDKVLEVMLHGG